MSGAGSVICWAVYQYLSSSFLLLGCCSLILYSECGFNQMPYGAPELVPMGFFRAQMLGSWFQEGSLIIKLFLLT